MPAIEIHCHRGTENTEEAILLDSIISVPLWRNLEPIAGMARSPGMRYCSMGQ